MNQICVIGGGASGIATAITVARYYPDIPVMILEKNSQLGKKILATGNGRCNITNSSIPGGEVIIDFLNTVGIITREEDDGRVYPFSGRAEDVVHLFSDCLETLGVKITTNFSVKEVVKQDSGFLILSHDNKKIKCSKVVLALGGKAAPQFGTIGEGYSIARSLGLSVTKTFPGLTWVETPTREINLHGVRVKGIAGLFRRGQLVAEENGEIQFTQKGLSGICIFNLSSQVVLGNGFSFEDYEISLDLMAGLSIDQVGELLSKRRSLKGLTIGNFLRSIIPSPLEYEVFSRSEVSLKLLDKPARVLKESELRLIANCLKNLRYPLMGIGGWKDAQIAVGGVSLDEVDQKTWEAHCVPGLYIVGELLDQQGPCGGYNLHNAWKTGIEAGKALGK